MGHGRRGANKPPVNFMAREALRASMTPMVAPSRYNVRDGVLYMDVPCHRCQKQHTVSERGPFDFTMLRANVYCQGKPAKLLVVLPPEIIQPGL